MMPSSTNRLLLVMFVLMYALTVYLSCYLPIRCAVFRLAIIRASLQTPIEGAYFEISPQGSIGHGSTYIGRWMMDLSIVGTAYYSS